MRDPRWAPSSGEAIPVSGTLSPGPCQREKKKKKKKKKSGKKMGGRVKMEPRENTARTRTDAPVVDACVSEHDRHVPQVLLYHGTLGDRKKLDSVVQEKHGHHLTGAKKTW